MASERIHRNGDERFIVKCGNTDIVLFNEWWVETIKERRSDGWFGDSWTREEKPLDFTHNFSLGSQIVAPLDPTAESSVGYRAIKHTRYFIGGPAPDPNIPEDVIVGVRADYAFDNEQFFVEAGANWPLKLFASIVIVALIVLAVVAVGWLLGAFA